MKEVYITIVGPACSYHPKDLAVNSTWMRLALIFGWLYFKAENGLFLINGLDLNLQFTSSLTKMRIKINVSL